MYWNEVQQLNIRVWSNMFQSESPTLSYCLDSSTHEAERKFIHYMPRNSAFVNLDRGLLGSDPPGNSNVIYVYYISCPCALQCWDTFKARARVHVEYQYDWVASFLVCCVPAKYLGGIDFVHSWCSNLILSHIFCIIWLLRVLDSSQESYLSHTYLTRSKTWF